VAIKVLAPHLATSGAARQRFAREAQAAAAVVHNNVVAIHGVDDTGDLPFLVMPYLRGTSLQKRIDRSGALSLSETLRIALQTARGLAAAHDQGLVHRDIKPANILLDGTTERVLLTDFGLARAADDASLTHSGVIAGTPYYMSPEQAEGAAIDHRSDLFSLGSVLYAMCTGRPPFRADTSWGILRRVTDSEPHPIRDVNPDVPEWLCRIIERLHCKHPGSRYQSADEVASLLEDCLAHVQQPDRFELPECVRETESAPVGQFSRIRKLAISAAVALAASLVAIAAWPDKEAQMHSQAPAPVTSNSRHANPEDGSLTTRPNQNELNQTSVSSAQSDLNALPDASDESLLSWDDTTDELSEIRSAVQQLDDDTLNLLSEKPQVEPDDR
jgi:serine/threonine-protein kinase